MDASPRRLLSDTLIVFGVAFAVRLVCLLNFREVPFFQSLIVDSKRYDEWAQEIAGGNWLGSSAFYQAPLYPYALGIFYRVFGHDLFWVRFAQILLGSCSCLLLMHAGRLFFSRTIGFVAGLLLALYAPAIFFDTLIQKSVLDTFFMSGTLLTLGLLLGARAPSSAFAQADKPALCLTLGLVLGCFTLTRENILLFIPVAIAWCLLHNSRLFPSRVKNAAALLVGSALILLPVYVRNVHFGSRTGITTYAFGTNLYIGNGANATGTYVALVEERGATEYEETDSREVAEKSLGRKLSPDEISQFWFSRTLAEISAKPGAWGILMLRKFLFSLNRIELIDTDDIYFYEQFSFPLRLLNSLLNFGLLIPLAVAGIIMTRSRWRDLAILYALGIVVEMTLIAFYVVARYRHPLVPLLILFAAPACVEGWRRLRAHEAGTLRRPALGALLAGCVAFLPVVSKKEQLATSFFNVAGIYHATGDLDNAALYYEKALDLGRTTTATYMNLGNTLYDAGKFSEARKMFQKALGGSSDLDRICLNIGNTYLNEHQPEKALEQYDVAKSGGKDSAELENAVGLALQQQGKNADAQVAFENSLKLKLGYPAATMNLSSLLAGLGKHEEARKVIEDGLKASPGNKVMLERLQKPF